jgi:hypothetical protein
VAAGGLMAKCGTPSCSGDFMSPSFPCLGPWCISPARHSERSRPTFSSRLAPVKRSACAERNLSPLHGNSGREFGDGMNLAHHSPARRGGPLVYPERFLRGATSSPSSFA